MSPHRSNNMNIYKNIYFFVLGLVVMFITVGVLSFAKFDEETRTSFLALSAFVTILLIIFSYHVSSTKQQKPQVAQVSEERSLFVREDLIPEFLEDIKEYYPILLDHRFETSEYVKKYDLAGRTYLMILASPEICDVSTRHFSEYLLKE